MSDWPLWAMCTILFTAHATNGTKEETNNNNSNKRNGNRSLKMEFKVCVIIVANLFDSSNLNGKESIPRKKICFALNVPNYAVICKSSDHLLTFPIQRYYFNAFRHGNWTWFGQCQRGSQRPCKLIPTGSIKTHFNQHEFNGSEFKRENMQYKSVAVIFGPILGKWVNFNKIYHKQDRKSWHIFRWQFAAHKVLETQNRIHLSNLLEFFLFDFQHRQSSRLYVRNDRNTFTPLVGWFLRATSTTTTTPREEVLMNHQ